MKIYLKYFCIVIVVVLLIAISTAWLTNCLYRKNHRDDIYKMMDQVELGMSENLLAEKRTNVTKGIDEDNPDYYEFFHNDLLGYLDFSQSRGMLKESLLQEWAGKLAGKINSYFKCNRLTTMAIYHIENERLDSIVLIRQIDQDDFEEDLFKILEYCVSTWGNDFIRQVSAVNSSSTELMPALIWEDKEKFVYFSFIRRNEANCSWVLSVTQNTEHEKKDIYEELVEKNIRKNKVNDVFMENNIDRILLELDEKLK